jgi:ABC-type antimicrobial peptide transport system permease subunit
VLGGLFSVAAFSATYGFGLVLGSMNWPMLLAYGLGSIAAAVVLSIIAALYPANFAARMVPATALRTNI